MRCTAPSLIAGATALLSASLALAQEDNGTAVIAIDADPGHLNPGITTGANVHVVADSMFNGLVALDEDLEPVPDLAISWEISDDSREYTFHLAEDVRWHDGEPFTSEDVKFTFENVLFEYHSRSKAGLGDVVDGITAPDEHTIVFRMQEPYGPLLQRLDVTEAPILPQHVFAGGDPNDHPANLDPVGTGPFRLASYETGDTVTLERNPDYFKEGLPHLERLIFRVIPDATTQVLALQQGEVDYVNRLPLGDVERLEEAGGITLLESSAGAGGGNCIMTVSFNLERDVVAPLEVRQAIAHAIDRQRIVDQVLFGWGEVAHAPISSAIAWAHWPPSLESYGHDPAKAQELLDTAGRQADGDGPRFSIDMVHFPTFNKYAELMKQDLAEVGIDLISRPLDRAATVEAIFDRRDFDTNLISYCNGTDPDIGVKRMYVSSNIGPVPFSNAAAYRNEKVDALFDAAGRSSDVEERRAAYHEVQEILGRELPYWWLVETTFVTGHQDTLTGFSPWTGQFAERARYK